MAGIPPGEGGSAADEAERARIVPDDKHGPVTHA
jgi:hypothetical protein